MLFKRNPTGQELSQLLKIWILCLFCKSVISSYYICDFFYFSNKWLEQIVFICDFCIQVLDVKIVIICPNILLFRNSQDSQCHPGWQLDSLNICCQFTDWPWLIGRMTTNMWLLRHFTSTIARCPLGHTFLSIPYSGSIFSGDCYSDGCTLLSQLNDNAVTRAQYPKSPKLTPNTKIVNAPIKTTCSIRDKKRVHIIFQNSCLHDSNYSWKWPWTHIFYFAMQYSQGSPHHPLIIYISLKMDALLSF